MDEYKDTLTAQQKFDVDCLKHCYRIFNKMNNAQIRSTRGQHLLAYLCWLDWRVFDALWRGEIALTRSLAKTGMRLTRTLENWQNGAIRTYTIKLRSSGAL